MKTKDIKTFALLAFFAAAISIADGQSNREDQIAANRLSIDQIRDYRKMTRVNKLPMDMVEQTKTMCAAPSMMLGPHYDPGVVYYINDVARRGLISFEKKRLFPVGSIIVKEKQERRTEDSVQIVTVMKKVRADNGEDSWEYKMYDVKKWAEVAASSEQHQPMPVRKTCIECHRRYKSNDYVSDRGLALLLTGQ